MKNSLPRPVVLCILDGWGYRAEKKDNAIEMGQTPNWHRFIQTYPHCFIKTSGEAVGLPHGQMGNSEVGHMNMGAGRVIMQSLPLIDQALAKGELQRKKVFQDFVQKLKKSKGTCHLMGLLSPGGVHSHQDQILAVGKLVAAEGIPVAIHGFLDGRDTPPQSGKEFVADFLKKIADVPLINIVSIGGRYYGMDRDQNWDRVQKAYDAIVSAQAPQEDDLLKAIEKSYGENINDEFLKPVVISSYNGMKDGDGIFMANFRADRIRQMADALANPNFSGFKRSKVISFAACLGLMEYSKDLNAFYETIFPPEPLTHILGQVVSESGKKQLRIAETEKYAHVTFFFNGGEEKVFPGEDRILVQSPKVATFDLKPEMAAFEITDKLVSAIEQQTYDLIVVNYANGDMVGHSGILEAAIKAAGVIDQCLARLETSLQKVGGCMFVTADHGNCEMMKDPVTGQPHTQHTTNDVYGILVNAPEDVKSVKDGSLADISPTLLELMDLQKPAEMTTHSLLVRK